MGDLLQEMGTEVMNWLLASSDNWVQFRCNFWKSSLEKKEKEASIYCED
jgi:hypothetical protein